MLICLAASLLAIGGGALVLSKVDPGFNEFMGAASVKVCVQLPGAPFNCCLYPGSLVC